MQRITLSILAAALALAACADPTSTPVPVTAPDVRPSAAVVLAPCTGCAYGDVRFDRTLGVRYEQANFTADPARSWVLVVTDDGGATTGAEVLLNGVQRVSKADLLAGGVNEVRVPVSLQASNTLLVRMHGPLGASAVVRVEPAPAAALVITPDPVERLPGGTQQFAVTSGGSGPYLWSVNGIDGGNSTFGTISATGFYTAPDAVPTPATFEVCARRVAAPADRGCATVTINPIPTAGADVVVFNDVNVFDDGALANANNRRLVRNLVTFSGTGPRSGGDRVVIESGHNSAYVRCFDTRAESEMVAEGLTVQRLSSATIGTQPAAVKVLILCLPTIPYTRGEINAMKSFSAQGGRIIFVGEHSQFYGAGIPIENQFLIDMGAVMRNIGDFVDCGYNTLPASSLRSQQIMTGLTDLTIACASVITLGPNDFALFYDRTNTRVLAGVAKVDVTPLPAMAAASAAMEIAPQTRRATAEWVRTHDPIGNPITRQRR